MTQCIRRKKINSFNAWQYREGICYSVQLSMYSSCLPEMFRFSNLWTYVCLQICIFSSYFWELDTIILTQLAITFQDAYGYRRPKQLRQPVLIQQRPIIFAWTFSSELEKTYSLWIFVQSSAVFSTMSSSKIKIKMKTLKMSSQMSVTSGMIIILLYFSLSEHLEGWQLLLAGNNLLKSGCSVALELCCSRANWTSSTVVALGGCICWLRTPLGVQLHRPEFWMHLLAKYTLFRRFWSWSHSRRGRDTCVRLIRIS